MRNEPIVYYKNNSDSYPEILNRYERMPDGLYLIGAFPDPSKRAVAIVGARSCSEYGRGEAFRFASVLAAEGVQIISGMALGIDSAAHEGALDAGGRTFAVFGCGVDVCYPSSKIRLYRRIIENGGIFSEFEPGTPALAHHFPIRNRIISALADAVLVVEARRKSGSLITASYALEQNKTIYALPGRVRDSLAEGTNDLICQGAVPAISPEQILHDLGVVRPERKKRKTKGPGMDPEEEQLYRCLSCEPKDLSRLQEESSLPVHRIAAALTRLQLFDLVRESSPGRYIRR